MVVHYQMFFVCLFFVEFGSFKAAFQFVSFCNRLCKCVKMCLLDDQHLPHFTSYMVGMTWLI